MSKKPIVPKKAVEEACMLLGVALPKTRTYGGAKVYGGRRFREYPVSWQQLSAKLKRFANTALTAELLGEDDWILLTEKMLCRLGCCHTEVMQVVRRSYNEMNKPNFEMKISGPRTWIRASNLRCRVIRG